MYSKYELDTGLRVLVEPMNHVRSVTVGLWIKSGSRFEPEGKFGISHLLEHMLFKGTNTRSAKEIAQEVDQIGGQINAFTSKEYTCIYMKVMDHHFNKAIDILSDMYFNAIFDENDLKKEQNVVIEELKMYEDIPDEYVHDLVVQSCYQEHGLAHNILGEKDSVGDITRDDLLKHYHRFFTPENTVLSICGNVNPDDSLKSVREIFDTNYQSGDHVPILNLDTPCYHPGLTKKDKNTEQVHFCLAFPGIKVTDERLFQMGILNNIIGGGMSSRFFQEIRERRGLCYSIFSYYLNFLDSGLFIIYAGFSKAYYQETYDLMWEILTSIKNYTIEETELERAKEQVKGNIVMGLESTSNRMARLGKDALLKNQILTYDEIINAIDRVEIAQLVALAQNIFVKEGEASALIGPGE